MMPIVLMPCSTLKMLRSVKKYGLANDIPTQSAIRASNTPASRTANTRRMLLAATGETEAIGDGSAATPLGRDTVEPGLGVEQEPYEKRA